MGACSCAPLAGPVRDPMNAAVLDPVVASVLAAVVDGGVDGRLAGLGGRNLPACSGRVGQVELNGVNASAGAVEERPFWSRRAEEIDVSRVQVLGQFGAVGDGDDSGDA